MIHQGNRCGHRISSGPVYFLPFTSKSNRSKIVLILASGVTPKSVSHGINSELFALIFDHVIFFFYLFKMLIWLHLVVVIPALIGKITVYRFLYIVL